MANGNSFSWLAFLLGLAIGLWISFVVFFLTDHDDDESCCGSGGTNILTYPGPDEAWAPGGDGDYFCTNDDQGRAIVIDQGRAVVADQGRAIVIDNGQLDIDQGSAVVADAGGFVPVPGSDPDQLGRPREFEEFKCDSNDQGGAIVADRSGRIVVVAMPASLTYPSNQCARVDGNAVVVNAAGEIIRIDQGGAVVADQGSAIVADGLADPAKDQTLGASAPKSDSTLAYCMVATATSDPIVIRP